MDHFQQLHGGQNRPGLWIGAVLQDVRYALRGFGRYPLFALSATITIALGMGATTAVFSVVDRILFRPLPYADANSIVSVGMVHSLEHQEFLMGRSYVEWQKYQTPFSSLAAQSTMVHNCDLVEDNPAQLSCLSFQAGFLPLLGVSPVLGRNFLPAEDSPRGPAVVMLSYHLWQAHYGGDPHILSRVIKVDGTPSRVVGILPKDFEFPTLETADIVTPFAFDPAVQQTVNGGFGDPMRLFARLKPGVSLAQARARLQPLFENDLNWLPSGAKQDVRLSMRTLRDRETQEVRPVAWILFGFVLAVLLIACANVAGLMMARGAGRQQELAVRSALGASRERLIRQTLTEALLLASTGGLAGLGIAQVLLLLFVRLAPVGIPFLDKAHLDLRIAAFSGLLSCLCAVIFGLAAALEKPRLASLNAKASLTRSHAWLRRSLVTAQIAITIVLLSGAVLLLRSFAKIETQNLGLKIGGVLTVRVALPQWRYDTDQKVMDFYLRLESALRALPGTRAVGLADSAPPGGSQGSRYSELAVEGRPPTPPGSGGTVTDRLVTPDYFRALNIPIVRGRGFSDQARTAGEPQAVLSRLLAERMFPGEDPIGKRIRNGLPAHDCWSTVVGVADNVKNHGLTEESDPELYTLRSSVAESWSGKRWVVVLDSVVSPSTIEAWVRPAITSMDRTLPFAMEPLSQTVSAMADRPRFETALLSFFALMGWALAVVGLYGLIAFMTTQRRREIGVRMALGATRPNILTLITMDGLRMVAVGVALGLGLALAASRLLSSLLFQVSAYDPVTYLIVPLLLALVALIAIFIPARAAMLVEPAVTLRDE